MDGSIAGDFGISGGRRSLVTYDRENCLALHWASKGCLRLFCYRLRGVARRHLGSDGGSHASIWPTEHNAVSVGELYDQIRIDTDVWASEIHGLEHWRRVEENGHMVAEFNGGDKAVVTYFAYLHDCQRWNDFEDPRHGPRACDYAKKNRHLIDLESCALQTGSLG